MYSLSDLVQRAVTRLSMVPGVAVQVYAEDRLAEMIQHKFDTVRDMLWWDDMMEWQVLTQDSMGRPTENVVRLMPDVPVGDEIVINQFKDVQYAWREGQSNPLRSISRRYNPMAYMRVGRTGYIAPDQTKVIRFMPYEPGRQMLIRYRKWYGPFQPDDVVPMDDQLLVLGACYDYLEDDGTNPGQTEKFRNFYNDRLRQLLSQENDREIELSPSTYPDINGWQVVN